MRNELYNVGEPSYTASLTNLKCNMFSFWDSTLRKLYEYFNVGSKPRNEIAVMLPQDKIGKMEKRYPNTLLVNRKQQSKEIHMEWLKYRFLLWKNIFYANNKSQSESGCDAKRFYSFIDKLVANNRY